MTIHVEILQVADCPHAEIAHRRVLDASTGVSIALTVTEVRDETDAARLGMRGSPTILIEGNDRFNDLDDPTSCSCRVRPGKDPVPTVDDIHAHSSDDRQLELRPTTLQREQRYRQAMASRRALIVLSIGVLYLAAACTSGNDATPTPSTPTTRAAASVLVDPEAFARRVEDPTVVTINVHVPNEGNIVGTDLEIPFDQIASSTKLPADLSTPLAVYCRSGNMSATAVQDLKAKGYVDVVELRGGYDAWLASGRTLETP